MVLLSRGNLGLDVPPEKGAIVQKAAINSCNLLGKPVVITRVVDTMATAPRCTRLVPGLSLLPGQAGPIMLRPDDPVSCLQIR